MARHATTPTPRGRLRSRHWGVLIGTLAVVGLGATAGIATTGGFTGSRSTSETPAAGGRYVTTVEDGKLTRLEFVPDGATAAPSATLSPSATATGTPTPSATASASASSTAPAATTTAAPTAKPPATTSAAPSATLSPSRSATGTPAPSTSSSPAASSTAPPAAAAGDWLSGVSGEGDTDGRFGAWRGMPVEIVGTWADADEGNQRRIYTVTGGSGRFAGPIDVGVGALVRGETWAAAARGANDARWRESLTVMRDARAGKGTTYIRFAHEMNGNWYPWAVNASNRADFITAWKRYRALQREIFPQAKLVFSVNRESVGSGIDWRTTFPGPGQVDVMSVDYYNFAGVSTAAEWRSEIERTDRFGAPIGLEQHRRFAASVGLPLAVSEWSGRASEGDDPEFMSQMQAFFKANGGAGAGNLLYEIVFNIGGYEGNYQLWPQTSQPAAAARYRDVF